MDVALEARENFQNNDLGPFDWFTVKSYMTSLNNMELEGVHPYSVPTCCSNLAQINLQATRACLLRGESYILIVRWLIFNLFLSLPYSKSKVGMTFRFIKLH